MVELFPHLFKFLLGKVEFILSVVSLLLTRQKKMDLPFILRPV